MATASDHVGYRIFPSSPKVPWNSAKVEDPEGCTSSWFNLQGTYSSVMCKIKLIFLNKIPYSFLIIKYDWNWELICFFITTCAPGLYTKIFQRRWFLTASLALLNIVSILLLMSRSLIKTKIHASYSLLFTQHSYPLHQGSGEWGKTNGLQFQKFKLHGFL